MVQPQMENLLCLCRIKTQAKKIFHIISVIHNLETVFSLHLLHVLASSSKVTRTTFLGWHQVKTFSHLVKCMKICRSKGEQKYSRENSKTQGNTSFTLYKVALMLRWSNINSYFVFTTGCFFWVEGKLSHFCWFSSQDIFLWKRITTLFCIFSSGTEGLCKWSSTQNTHHVQAHFRRSSQIYTHCKKSCLNAMDLK